MAFVCCPAISASSGGRVLAIFHYWGLVLVVLSLWLPEGRRIRAVECSAQLKEERQDEPLEMISSGVPSSGQDGREEMDKALMPSVGALKHVPRRSETGASESGVLQRESAYSFMEPSPGIEVAAAEPEKGVLIAA